MNIRRVRFCVLLLAATLLLMTGLTSCGSGDSAKEGAAGSGQTCELTIRCDTALKSDKLKEGKRNVLPEDAVIYASKEVAIEEGDTVYDVLRQETKANKIQMEASESPVYGSQYVEGICNLYEFDCGNLSGWVYKVNDTFPEVGCSEYEVHKGDHIQWLYSCDLGKDVGKEGWKK